MVARLLWEQDVVGSNPAAPTKLSTRDTGPFAEGADRSHGAAQAPCSEGVTSGHPLARKLVPLAGERERLLSVGEVADRLGVSTATVYKLCARAERHLVLQFFEQCSHSLAALDAAYNKGARGPGSSTYCLRADCVECAKQVVQLPRAEEAFRSARG